MPKQKKLTLKINAQKLALAARFRCEHQVMEQITGLRIEPLEEGGCVIVGLNGHTMGVVRDQHGHCSEPMTLKVSEELLFVCNRNEQAQNYTVKIIDRRLAVVCGDTEVFIQAGSPTWTTSPAFPDWRVLIAKVYREKGSEQLSRITLSSGDFSRMKNIIPGQKGVRLFPTTLEGPLLVTVGGHTDFIGIAMPMKDYGEEDTTAPWVKELITSKQPENERATA